MKKYTATLKSGSPILSVHADTLKEALLELARQFGKNPQRREIHKMWKAHGSKVIQE